ncbi:MAG: gluconokinase [Comamonadaceae bacterium]|nr:MAG: gluconokinase [Comamonadaceae bacterium]
MNAAPLVNATASSAGAAPAIVVMGVAGCGKSSFGQLLAAAAGLACIEGDDYHAPASIDKMKAGRPLNDSDRDVWLDTLGVLLARQQPQGVVLTCSALRLAYRQRLRAARAGLRFVFLRIAQDEAQRRVAARSGHIFPASLLQSQFDTLESPDGEAGVLTLDAAAPADDNLQRALAWLRTESPA